MPSLTYISMSVEMSLLPCTGLHFLLDHEHMRLCAFCYSNGKESLGNHW